MVKRCIAAGCSNTTSATVSLHKFPSNPAIRQLWVKAVQKTRAEWKGPSEHSRLCSEHFEDSCSESNVGIASKMGIQTLRRLKADAIPTIFVRPETPGNLRKRSCSAVASSSTNVKRRRGAYEKRERSRVSDLVIII